MFCFIHDPHLARLLAGKDEVMPGGWETLLVGSVLGLEILCLLALGAVPW